MSKYLVSVNIPEKGLVDIQIDADSMETNPLGLTFYKKGTPTAFFRDFSYVKCSEVDEK